MTSELQAVTAPLLAQMHAELGNGFAAITVEASAIAEGELPVMEYAAYHFAAGFSGRHDNPTAAVHELLTRFGREERLARAEHMRDVACELEKSADKAKETKCPTS